MTSGGWIGCISLSRNEKQKLGRHFVLAPKQVSWHVVAGTFVIDRLRD